MRICFLHKPNDSYILSRARYFVENGHQVRILDVQSSHLNNVDYINGSILDLDAVKKATFEVDVIYHFAGVSNIDKVKDNPLKTIEFNILGTANLIEQARKQKVNRFLFASSVYVFDRGGHLYTYSKRVSEDLCKYYKDLYDLPFSILRLGSAYGPRSRGEDVISIFVKNSLEGQTMCVKGGGSQIRNFIYVEELAEGCVKALSEKCKNNIITLAGNEQINIRELSFIVKKLFLWSSKY
ncbi:MAG: NAD-dependent epimerase/dehydratase family protein [SAR202 cluster bacterium]|nr:NAD-dependent epimerase/dehydratase family protein [SAR202 cluster bacterium]